jgi:hypothetical protein
LNTVENTPLFRLAAATNAVVATFVELLDAAWVVAIILLSKDPLIGADAVKPSRKFTPVVTPLIAATTSIPVVKGGYRFLNVILPPTRAIPSEKTRRSLCVDPDVLLNPIHKYL